LVVIHPQDLNAALPERPVPAAAPPLTPREADGKVVLIARPRDTRNYRAASQKLREAKPAAVLMVDQAREREGPARADRGAPQAWMRFIAGS
jgi:hypothetical protein